MKYKKREWLCELRAEADMTQEDVAVLSSIDRSTYTKAELGYSVHIKTAKAIAKVLEFDWTCFYNEEI